MREIAHSFLQFIDGVFFIFWGMNTLEILQIIVTGNGIFTMANAEGVLKILFSVVGLVYAGFRLYSSINMYEIDKKIKIQDLREKELKNKKMEENEL